MDAGTKDAGSAAEENEIMNQVQVIRAAFARRTTLAPVSRRSLPAALTSVALDPPCRLPAPNVRHPPHAAHRMPPTACRTPQDPPAPPVRARSGARVVPPSAQHPPSAVRRPPHAARRARVARARCASPPC
ncbi:hypothetical protein GGX14DRAFT_563621 [Mycena pura]|uniref:Uncharacterized protein n=1 Tax=Mycena pura TaxID=153505 RepID=A0AAD6YCT9_9AGAR|nr:hypothetical protein GGX14DRAFT_563621 [Mycena pura]